MSLRQIVFGLFGCVLSLSCGFAYADAGDVPDRAVDPDPYETYNRHAYNLNRAMDKFIFTPPATIYKTILPKPVQRGVLNMFDNLLDPADVLNDTLQGHFYWAAKDTWRFLINTTIGIGGFFDVAAKMGLEKRDQDFGQTLAHWGYHDSNYLVLPFFGPGTVRDGIALPLDYYYLTVPAYLQDVALRNSLFGLWIVAARANMLDYDKTAHVAALDGYVFERDAYLQHRRYIIEKNDQGYQ